MSNLARAIAAALTSEYKSSVPDGSEHEFSEKFEKKMNKLIKKRNLPFYMLINTAGKRIAGIVIGIIIALSAAVISIEALREGFIDFITMIFGDHSVVRSVETENAPEIIEEIYGITADISGYEVIFEEYDTYAIHIGFAKDNSVIIFKQHIKNKGINYNTENSEVISVDINGREAIYYLDNHNYHNIIWNNGYYTFFLSSDIGKDELISLAKSVEKIE